MTLVVGVSILALASLVQDFRFHRSVTDTRAAALAVSDEIGTLQVALSDFRAAEAGYLAAAQGADFWMRRANDLSDQMSRSLDELRSGSASPDARTAYDAAAAALSDLMSVDKRARTNIQTDQRFVASDVIFVDGLQASQRLATSLGTAKAAEARTADAEIARAARWRLGMNAGIVLLVLGALVVVSVATPAPAASAVSEAAAVAQMIRDLPPPVKSPSTATVVRSAPAPTPAPAPAPATAGAMAVPVPTINLTETADLCVDLARVADGRDIPGLLDRTAKVLEAKGVIVWVADKAGSTLHPSLAHGYSEKVMTKLGSLQVGADNVTSLSFRSMRPQMMNGTTPGAAGAIAVPLVTTAGCSGVLAAEVRESKPTAELIAVAKIIAAQFATIIAPEEITDVRAAQA